MSQFRFNFIDLFAGIGGFHIALKSLNGQCVFTSEIDSNARQTYIQNHGGEIFGDIREITGPLKLDSVVDLMIPDHDVLAAGFPCQPFSLAGVSARNSLGKAHGLLDEVQGTLFYDIARIVKIKKPRALLLENVSNLINHDNGRTFNTIKQVIEGELGYQLFYKVINSQSVVPQRRKRCFMVAFRDPVEEFDFPEIIGNPIPLRTALEDNVDEKYTISDKSWAGHQRRTKSNLERGTGFTAFEADLDRPANTLVARYYKDGKECLVPQEGKNPRFLTPRECARLQGFPEDFKPHPTRSAAYKQFGNAVAVPVVKLVAEKMLSAMNGINTNNGQADKKRTLAEHVRNKGKEHKARAGSQEVSA